MAAAVLATAIAWLADRFISLDDLSAVFIVAVAVTARTRMTAAVLAAGQHALKLAIGVDAPRLIITEPGVSLRYVGARAT